ncbi:type II toxin-antitoxin system VapC family toxin [soil metagenome]
MFILDTCTLIWLILQQEELSNKAKSSIHRHAGSLFVSSMSAFEITMHANKKVLILPSPPLEWFNEALLRHGLIEIPVDANIASSSVQLPPIHKDPIDRIIIATAARQKLNVLTPDKHMHAYSQAKCIW